MWKLLILTVALAQQHPAEFKAGWEKAKARAALWVRSDKGLIDDDSFMEEFSKLLTPQEKDDCRRRTQRHLERSLQRSKEHEATLKRIQAELDRIAAKRPAISRDTYIHTMPKKYVIKATPFVGPPPPPDMK